MWGPKENPGEDIGEVQSSYSSRHQNFEDASPTGSCPEQQRQWSGAGLSSTGWLEHRRQSVWATEEWKH